MKIGSIEIPQLCRLAPMAAISNAPFRLIAKECGSGLTTTEEMDAFAVLMDTPRAGDMAAYDPQERPLAMQLLGRDPQALIRAAYRCEELGTDIVDQLLARKAATRELGTSALPGPIGALIDSEFSKARDLWPSEPWRPDASVVTEANSFFRNWVGP